jgi:hypothetical protein
VFYKRKENAYHQRTEQKLVTDLGIADLYLPLDKDMQQQAFVHHAARPGQGCLSALGLWGGLSYRFFYNEYWYMHV